jgi:hypothetical protein
MRQRGRVNSKFSMVNIIALASLIGLTGCTVPSQQGIMAAGGTPPVITPPPDPPPAEPNVVSLDPLSWFIFYSGRMPPNPSSETGAAWSFAFPSAERGGHVNYVQTPFRATTTLQSVTMTFRVESDQPLYDVIDPADRLPATFHIFFEQLGDNLVNPDGRWWAHGGYNLGSQDNQTITLTVPLTSDNWTNVDGQTDPEDFAAAWANVGWIGVTFGGQFFWGHGVALARGTATFVLINFEVD